MSDNRFIVKYCGVLIILVLLLLLMFGFFKWNKRKDSSKEVENNNNHTKPTEGDDKKPIENQIDIMIYNKHCNTTFNSTNTQNEIKGELFGLTSTNFYEGDIIFTYDDDGKIQQSTSLWPDKLIPYELKEKCFNENYINSNIVRAINELESKTCIRFKPVTTEQVYLSIRCMFGCSSNIGYWRSNLAVEKQPRYMSIDPEMCSYGNVLHEFLHALGVHHMHNAYKRDSHVKICYDNMKNVPQKELFFRKTSANDVSDSVFDFESIMMLPLNIYSKDNSLYTIFPLVRNVSANIGQRKGLSTNDIQMLNKLYEC